MIIDRSQLAVDEVAIALQTGIHVVKTVGSVIDFDGCQVNDTRFIKIHDHVWRRAQPYDAIDCDTPFKYGGDYYKPRVVRQDNGILSKVSFYTRGGMSLTITDTLNGCYFYLPAIKVVRLNDDELVELKDKGYIDRGWVQVQYVNYIEREQWYLVTYLRDDLVAWLDSQGRWCLHEGNPFVTQKGYTNPRLMRQV